MDEDGADLGAQPASSWLAMMGEGVRPQTAPPAKHRYRPPVWVSSSLRLGLGLGLGLGSA